TVLCSAPHEPEWARTPGAAAAPHDVAPPTHRCAHRASRLVHDSPARPGLASRPSGDRDRAGVEGPAAAMGPFLPPDVLVPGELSGGTRPCLHRPVLAPG